MKLFFTAIRTMTKSKLSLFFRLLSLAIVFACGLAFATTQNSPDDKCISYRVDTKSQDLQFYWRDETGEIFKSILNLKIWLDKKQKKLLFAMNGGMYKPDNSPRGLFIQEQKTLTSLDTSSGNGNFYLKPNGVFYVNIDKTAVICKTEDFKDNGRIRFATQSGPLLIIDGEIHPPFRQGSNNLNIRNGVGILPDKRIVFAMSKEPINFYEFAQYFKKLGCKNALYLDGFVSRTYLPEKKWVQTDGDFGVIIGVVTSK